MITISYSGCKVMLASAMIIRKPVNKRFMAFQSIHPFLLPL